MTNKGIDIQHSKLRGEWAELRFMARAAELGLRVSKPFGDCADYDATVEHHGIFHRVQIKSTKAHQRRSHSYACCLRRTNGSLYTNDQIDFFAAYVIPCDVWYIFPVEVVTGLQDVTLSPHLPESKHAPYKEAWHLLTGKKGKKARLGTATQACPERSRRGRPAEQSSAGSAAPTEGCPQAENEDTESRTVQKEEPLSTVESRLRDIQSRLLSSPHWGPRRR